MSDKQHETRVKDPVTGAEKGSKLARFDLLPVIPLRELAEHYGRGAKKYADRNWEKGYKWSLSFAALCRHLFAFWNGEDYDTETGSHHLTAVAWHAFALREFQARSLGTDDRARQFKPLIEDPGTPTREVPACCHTAWGSCERCTLPAPPRTFAEFAERESIPVFCGKCEEVHDTSSECWADFPAAEPPAVGPDVDSKVRGICANRACPNLRGENSPWCDECGGTRGQIRRNFCLVCHYAEGEAHDRHGCGLFR